MAIAGNNRRGLRFQAEEGTLIQIDPSPDTDRFNPTMVGLVLDEAAHGCGAVLLTSEALREGGVCRIKVGRLAPLVAEVKWLKTLDPQVMKVGFRYAGAEQTS